MTLDAEFRAALADALDNPPWLLPPIREIRGIVTAAGGDLYSRLAFHLIHCLRGLGCRLPVEVWHLPGEMPPDVAAVFGELDGVRLVSSDSAGSPPRSRPMGARHAGWWLKSHALRWSGFAEAMFLDADNVPAADPTYLFHDIGYERAGAMFWPDLPPPRERGEWVPEAAWRLVGLDPVPTARPFESGQILVDRRRHMAALAVAEFLNEWSDETYRVVYGDKDTFLLAWHLVGSRYHMPPRNPAWRRPAICQHDSAGNLAFQHACGAKQDLAAGKIIEGMVSRRFAPDAAVDFAAKLARHREKLAFRFESTPAKSS